MAPPRSRLNSNLDNRPIGRPAPEGRSPNARTAADPGVACAVRPSLSACDASTMRTSPAQNFANAT